MERFEFIDWQSCRFLFTMFVLMATASGCQEDNR